VPLYRALFHRAPDGLLLLDADGQILDANPVACALLGLERTALLGHRCDALDPPDPDLHELWSALCRDRQVTGRWARRGPDGSIRHIEYRGASQIAAGQHAAILWDATERDATERALAESQRAGVLVSEVGRALTGGGELREILQHCCETVVRELDAALARVWTLEDNDTVLVLQASAGLTTRSDGGDVRVPVGIGRVGMIASERRPHFTNDVKGDVRLLDRQWAEREGLMSFAGYPLIVGDRLAGVLALFSRRPLDIETLHAVEVASGGIGVGIERLRAEAALRRNEALFRALVENAEGAISLSDAQGRATYVSPILGRMLGRSPEDLRAEEGLPFLHHEDSPRFRRLMLDSLAQPGATLRTEVRAMHGDGSWRVVEATIVNRLDDPNVGAIVTNLRDVSQRVKAEEEWRRVEQEREQALQRLQMVLSRMPAGCILHDAQFVTTYWNPAAERIFGYSSEEACGRQPFELTVPPDRREAVGLLFGRIAEGEPVAGGLYENVTRDGRRIQCEWDHTALFDERGRFSGLVCMVQDVSDRRRAEEDLRRQKEMLQSIVENVPALIGFMDESGRLVFVNREWKRVLGWSLEDTRALDFWERVYPDAEQRRRALEHVRSSESTWEDYKIRTRDGRIIESLWANVRLSDGTRIGIGQDLTERKRNEEALLASQRVEAVGRLAGGIAHDFNNLLMVITGYTQMLLAELEIGDRRRARVEQIAGAAQRAASLTRQLLAFSRKQLLQPRVLDLNEVLADFEKMLRRLIREDIELVLKLAPDLGRARVDPAQIEQVVMNLAINARDSMEGPGRLIIETSNVTFDASGAAAHEGIPPGSYVLLAVSDTGCGMDAETQSHAFEPFFTTKRQGHGTGLGLSTVHGIVRQSGGSITVYSEVGRGTTFKIYLPREASAATARRPAEESVASRSRSETVLLVEDEPSLRQMVLEILHGAGYRVLEAGGGEEALALSDREPGPIHLLLTDVIMPGMNGRVMAEQMVRRRPGTRVLYMSGYTAEAIGHHGILEEGTHFLQKPFTPNGLLTRVREVLDSRADDARAA
jgi:PAS domain S-box-containing protein